VIAFGPVPSRRLGRSVGINNIPPKNCTYSCVYCQLATPSAIQLHRRAFYAPEKILDAVSEKVHQAREQGESIDYLTFVPDGEPTLDSNLGREIDLLRPLGIKTAVITNGSLLWDENVRDALAKADWVSMKVDAASEEIWRRINRPHGRLNLSEVQDGMLAFAHRYEGILATETMLIAELNDSEDALEEVADFLACLEPDRSYLSIPTRPPGEDWVRAPDEETINRAYQIVGGRVDGAEYLIGYEGNAFASTGDAEEDLLSITAVHPMREDAVRAFLERAGESWDVVRRLVQDDQLIAASFGDHTFYVRKLSRHGQGNRCGSARTAPGMGAPPSSG